MNAEKVIQFPTKMPQEPSSREVRVADCDEGYTRLANEILETVYKTRINGNAMSVLLAIVRMTYGWNKSSDRIAGVQLADETGLSESEVSRALSQLVERRIIECTGDRRKAKIISINKRVDEWLLRKPATSIAQTRKSDCVNPQVGLRKHANTKDISPKTLSQRQDLNPYGPGTAEAIPDPVPEDAKIPPEAAVHERRRKRLLWGTRDDLTCAEWMVSTRARAYHAKDLPEPKEPCLASWANDIRLMRTNDKRNHQEICKLFAWVCKTGRELEFCQAPGKLRDKWDSLCLRRANAEQGITSPRAIGNIDAAAAAARQIMDSGIGGYSDDTIL
jgi:phage replication O-like protein O